MKATELRIKNLINYQTAEGDVLIATIDWQDLKWISEDEKGFNLAHSAIPLTEEWLLKFGFEWSIWHQAWHKLSFIFNLSERGVDGYYMHMVKKNNEIICPEIIYVHQLQNLYFTLTNEELTL